MPSARTLIILVGHQTAKTCRKLRSSHRPLPQANVSREHLQYLRLLHMQTADTYRKLRFTLRFLLGNLDGFEPDRDAVAYDQLPVTDRCEMLQLSNSPRSQLQLSPTCLPGRL